MKSLFHLPEFYYVKQKKNLSCSDINSDKGVSFIGIAIILLILGGGVIIGLPLYKEAKAKAQMTLDMSNMETMFITMMSYLSDYDRFPKVKEYFPPDLLATSCSSIKEGVSYGINKDLLGKTKFDFKESETILFAETDKDGFAIDVTTDIAYRHNGQAVIIYLDGKTRLVKAGDPLIPDRPDSGFLQ